MKSKFPKNNFLFTFIGIFIILIIILIFALLFMKDRVDKPNINYDLNYLFLYRGFENIMLDKSNFVILLFAKLEILIF